MLNWLSRRRCFTGELSDGLYKGQFIRKYERSSTGKSKSQNNNTAAARVTKNGRNPEAHLYQLRYTAGTSELIGTSQVDASWNSVAVYV